MSIFTYGIELWGLTYYSKYLNQIDKLINRAYKYGYISGRASIKEIINKRDKKLWSKITSKYKERIAGTIRRRAHEYELPRVRTERVKNSFINRCLFNLI